MPIICSSISQGLGELPAELHADVLAERPLTVHDVVKRPETLSSFARVNVSIDGEAGERRALGTGQRAGHKIFNIMQLVNHGDISF